MSPNPDVPLNAILPAKARTKGTSIPWLPEATGFVVRHGMRQGTTRPTLSAKVRCVESRNVSRNRKLKRIARNRHVGIQTDPAHTETVPSVSS